MFIKFKGTLAFGNVEDKVFEYGDVFWVLGGEVIGPMINSNNFTTLVLIMSTSPIVPYPGSDGIPSDDNPSVDPNLIRTRTYRYVRIRVYGIGKIILKLHKFQNR